MFTLSILIMNDKLFFYSKSRDAIPGQGVGEYVADVSLYSGLMKIKDWRKILSNFHVFPFQYEGYTYNTIEHAFQAKKIEIVDKDKAYLFTLESRSDIGTGNGPDARKNRKLCKLNPGQLKRWDEIKYSVLYTASLEKYTSCPDAQHVLKCTRNAELWHIVSRSQPVNFEHLEHIRSKF